MEHTILGTNQDLINWCSIRSNIKIHQKDISIVGTSIRLNGYIFNYSISDWALCQLSEFLGIPVKYMLKCSPEFRATTLNHWIGELSDREIKLCTRDIHNIIGIVDTKFINYPNIEIYEDTIERYGSRILLREYSLTDEVMDIKILFPDLVIGDHSSIGIGIHIRNSEVGHTPTIVVATIHDYGNNSSYIVDNLFGTPLIKVVHSGDLAEFQNSVGDLVDILQVEYKDIIRRYITTILYTITVGDLREIIENHKLSRDSLNEELGVDVFDTTISTKLNFRDIVNAIGRKATEYSYPERWHIEKIGGELITDYELSVLEV